MFKWIKSYMPKRLYYRAALILVLPVVLLQLIVSIVFIQRHFEGVTVQMTKTVAAELDLITEVIENNGAVAAQKIAKSLGMSMSIVSQKSEFLERRRIYDLTGLVVRRELLSLPEILAVDLPDNRRVNTRIKSGSEYFDLQFSRRRVSASNPHQLIVYLVVFGAFFTIIAFVPKSFRSFFFLSSRGSYSLFNSFKPTHLFLLMLLRSVKHLESLSLKVISPSLNHTLGS